MTSPQQSAIVFLNGLLKQWGLESLSGTVSDMLTAGDAAEVIPMKLRETEPYKKRFAANLARTKNGLPAQSEGEFLAAEAALKGVVRRYVGGGTYDSRDFTDKWIANDVSAQELNTRMQTYQDNFLTKQHTVIPIHDQQGNQVGETTVGQAWAAHGFTPADALKAVIDPNVTETSLRKQLGTYGLGAEALGAYHNANVLDPTQLGRFADAGVTLDQARRGFGDVAARQDYEGFLAHNAGTDLTRQEQENAALLNDTAADQKRRQVLGAAQAQFEGNHIGGINSLKRTGAAAQNY